MRIPAIFSTGPAKFALLGVMLASAGCVPPPEGRFEPSRAAEELPPAELVPTARFDGVVSGAAPDARRLEADARTLAGRVAGLRQAAETLKGPVIDADTRARLEAARSAEGVVQDEVAD